MKKAPRIGEQLVSSGVITQEQLEQSLPSKIACASAFIAALSPKQGNLALYSHLL